MRTDGTQTRLVSDRRMVNPNIAGDWIFGYVYSQGEGSRFHVEKMEGER
jgi:hypothetical protein